MGNSDLSQLELPQHCTPTNAFLYSFSTYFGSCIPTPLAFVSSLLGNLSILSWLCAQLPQIYKNFQLKSAAGLSPFFLIEWLLGDLCNLLGALFLDQATWQVVLAGYYVSVDICLVWQYFWYTYVSPWWTEGDIYSNGSDTDDDDANSDLINSLSPIDTSFAEDTATTTKPVDKEPPKLLHPHPKRAPHFSSANIEKEASDSAPVLNQQQWLNAGRPSPSPRTLMYTATLSSLVAQTVAAPAGSGQELKIPGTETPLQFAGHIISWCSTVLYLGSRLPQLYKNWKRQSTTGLSPYLFLAAFCGNLFYSTSMLTNPKLWFNMGPHGGNGWAGSDGSQIDSYIKDGAAFFLGAFLVLFMDGSMFVQFKLYGDQQEKVIKVRNGDGVGKWQRVSGWMRGWIPSLKQERVVDLSESQRLLGGNRDSSRRRRHSQYGGVSQTSVI